MMKRLLPIIEYSEEGGFVAAVAAMDQGGVVVRRLPFRQGHVPGVVVAGFSFGVLLLTVSGHQIIDQTMKNAADSRGQGGEGPGPVSPLDDSGWCA